MTRVMICDLCKKIFTGMDQYRQFEHKSEDPGGHLYVDDVLHFHPNCLKTLKQGTQDLSIYG